MPRIQRGRPIAKQRQPEKAKLVLLGFKGFEPLLAESRRLQREARDESLPGYKRRQAALLVLDYIKSVLDVYCEKTGIPWAHDEEPDDKLVRIAAEVPALKKYSRWLPKLVSSLRQTIAHTDYEVPDQSALRRATILAVGLGRVLSSEAARMEEKNSSPSEVRKVLTECSELAQSLRANWAGLGGDDLADWADHRVEAMERLLSSARHSEEQTPLMQLALAERERLRTDIRDLTQWEDEQIELAAAFADERKTENEEE